MAHPLHVLFKKKATWRWTDEQEFAKAELVNRLVSEPVLAHFDENIDVCLQTDASLIGLGAVLMQDSGNGPRPVAYVSRRLTETESIRKMSWSA
jgi:RNase H-like domain found in reverse transcriptase